LIVVAPGAGGIARAAINRAYRAMVKGPEVEQPKAWLYRIATTPEGSSV
jgi:hypothetical protein